MEQWVCWSLLESMPWGGQLREANLTGVSWAIGTRWTWWRMSQQKFKKLCRRWMTLQLCSMHQMRGPLRLHKLLDVAKRCWWTLIQTTLWLLKPNYLCCRLPSTSHVLELSSDMVDINQQRNFQRHSTQSKHANSHTYMAVTSWTCCWNHWGQWLRWCAGCYIPCFENRTLNFYCRMIVGTHCRV